MRWQEEGGGRSWEGGHLASGDFRVSFDKTVLDPACGAKS